jgi:hypothetical protein
MRVRTALALALGSLSGCADTVDALYAAGKAVPPYMPTTTGSSGDASTGESKSSTTSEATSTGAEASSSAPTSGEADTTGSATPPPPAIEVFDVPHTVTRAGPLRVRVYASHATAAEVRLDDAQLPLELIHEGDPDGDGVDLFSGEIPIYGSPDNGPHTLTATVRRDDLEDTAMRSFTVATPAAGSRAWEVYGGAGSKAGQIIVTPEGEVYEAGSFEINGLARPAVRRRDPVTGADVWPEGPRVLDVREGSVADLAVAPGGQIWAAMNVREGDSWVARIAAFTPEIQPTGASLEKTGATVTAIASTSGDGCFAVGFMKSSHGDADVLAWRMSAVGAPLLSGASWGYTNDGFMPHLFDDLAFDVVVDPLTDEAWIVGGSLGEHNPNGQKDELRGLILHVDTDTLDLLSPVFIAPPAGDLNHSMFYGAWLEPEGLLVSGYQCDVMCQTQRVLATRYNFEGLPTWGYSSPPASVAIGYGIASTRHGTILIAAAIQDGSTMHGYLLGREGIHEAFPPVALPGEGTSDATSVVVGPYDWPFTAGNVSLGGGSQAYVMHTHP